MDGTIDLFSGHADSYQIFRPTYPKALYETIFGFCTGFETAWDCATGNGQVASYLSKYFNRVEATDISEQQLEHAVQIPNIRYSIQRSEETHFKDASFDLVTVGQALHWFDHKAFFNECHRLIKPEGVLAYWSYATLTHPDKLINNQIQHFYREITGPYWHPRRRFVDNGYRSIIPHSMEIIHHAPELSIEVTWSVDELRGYLNTWSSVQAMLRQGLSNPVETFISRIGETLNERNKFIFPLCLWCCRIQS